MVRLPPTPTLFPYTTLFRSGGALTVALVMIVGLLVFVVWMGGGTFWPRPVLEVRTADGLTLLGEVTREDTFRPDEHVLDRKSTRLNSSHSQISYAVFCLKKK